MGSAMHGSVTNQERRAIDFVVTGTPRSGTKYLARVLSSCGIDCGHEKRFNPWEAVWSEPRRDDRPFGDSSWLVVPFLDQLPATTKLLHVVREPLKAINSIIGTGHFEWASDYTWFLLKHAGLTYSTDPEQVKVNAQRFWVTWNTRIENSGRVALRFQVEETEQVYREIIEILDPSQQPHLERLGEVLDSIPTDVNKRSHVCGPVLTESDLIPECRQLARRYGYAY